METSIKLGLNEYASVVQVISVPQAKTTKYFAMDQSGTNFYIVGSTAGSFSVWTDSVGPCHVVLVYGTPRKQGELGMIGLAHVSGKHEVIKKEAKKLVKKMEDTHHCEVFIVGGDREGVEHDHTFDPFSFSKSLEGKVKLVISPAVEKGYIKVELTGARKINIEKQ